MTASKVAASLHVKQLRTHTGHHTMLSVQGAVSQALAEQDMSSVMFEVGNILEEAVYSVALFAMIAGCIARIRGTLYGQGYLSSTTKKFRRIKGFPLSERGFC